MSESQFQQEYVLHQKLSEMLAREESFWRQKSRECWLREGDRKTSFFHKSAKVRRCSNRRQQIKSNQGNILTKIEDINREVVSYYTGLLNEDNSNVLDVVVSPFPL